MERRESDLAAIGEATRHCQAALAALTEAERTIREGSPYPTYLQIAAAEMAHATELALQVALRNRDARRGRKP